MTATMPAIEFNEFSPTTHKTTHSQNKFSFASTLDETMKAQQTHEIMQKYDMTNISFTELKEMGRKLLDADIISVDEYCTLTMPTRAIAERANGNPNWASMKINYQDDCSVELDFHQNIRYSDPRTYANLEHRLKLIRKLQEIRQ